MADLTLHDLNVSVGGKSLITDVGATAPAAAITAIVGPNGAGKSTLLKAAAALIPATGEARANGAALARLSPIERARTISYLPQHHDFAWAIPVRDMVALGRYAFGSAMTAQPERDVEAVLEECGIAALADRPVDRLSGGERALAAMARVLHADAPIMLLDEPVAALDIGRQYQLMNLLKARAERGTTIVMVLHDLALAAQYADRIWGLSDGRLVSDTANKPEHIGQFAAKFLGKAPHWTGVGDPCPTPFFTPD
jgi:iron complex transport system ATP-binding protein